MFGNYFEYLKFKNYFIKNILFDNNFYYIWIIYNIV